MDCWCSLGHVGTLRAVDSLVSAQAEEKMVFDKFHVAKHLSEAVDKVRRTEHRELHAEGDERLKGTKYDWLKGTGQFGSGGLA